MIDTPVEIVVDNGDATIYVVTYDVAESVQVVSTDQPTSLGAPAGPQGPMASIQVGSVTTLTQGHAATVAIREVSGSYYLDFGLPTGSNGSQIELQNSGGFIQWRPTGASGWTNLVSVTDLMASVVGGAPAALDTLRELADAINDDPNFYATITNMIATSGGSGSSRAQSLFTSMIF